VLSQCRQCDSQAAVGTQVVFPEYIAGSDAAHVGAIKPFSLKILPFSDLAILHLAGIRTVPADTSVTAMQDTQIRPHNTRCHPKPLLPLISGALILRNRYLQDHDIPTEQINVLMH
jgi:hypothetical protein